MQLNCQVPHQFSTKRLIVEARIEARAAEIETRADALCPRLAELDALESALELRLAGNAVLDLLQVQR